MPLFTPPIHLHGPRYHPDDVPYMARLRARQAPSPTGINLWLLTDGTLTLNQPAENSRIKRWFKGGSTYIVNNEEAALLTSAGYETDPFVGGYSDAYPGGY